VIDVVVGRKKGSVQGRAEGSKQTSGCLCLPTLPINKRVSDGPCPLKLMPCLSSERKLLNSFRKLLSFNNPKDSF
jgi:hypothetical protein